MELKILTKNGYIKGIAENGVRVWKGIPYAEDYTGENRYRGAKPHGSWDNILETTEFAPAAPQLPDLVGGIAEGDPTSEESLCINVWAPERTVGKKPVMVWIYGGGFVTGDGKVDMYNGAYLAASEEIIVVNFNYRINALGFLDFSAFISGAESNVGLRDQVLALKWVYENIEAFGGDSENITIFGQSAGGHSVTTLLSIPTARKYIARAIAMSAYPLSVNTPKQAEAYARRFLELMDIPAEDAQRLLSAPTDELVLASKKLEEEVSAACGFNFAFVPTVDGDFLPMPPIEAAAQPWEKEIPLLIGGAADEGSLYALEPIPLFPATKETMEKFLEQNRDFRSTKFKAFYRRFPRKRQSDKFGGDILFGLPCLMYADAYSRNAPVWIYRFSYHTLGLRLKKLYTMHGTDVPFAFNNLESSIAKAALMLTPVKTVPYRLRDTFSHELAMFASMGIASWERYSEVYRYTMDFGKNTRLSIHPLAALTEPFKKTAYVSDRLPQFRQT